MDLRRRFLVSAAFALVLPLVGCFEEEKKVPPVIVGARMTTEQRILGEILAQVVEDAGYPAERRFDFATPKDLHEAARANKIHLYPEYAGTALAVILRSQGAAEILRKDKGEILARVRTEYDSMGLRWMEPFGLVNSLVLVVRGGQAGVSISDIKGPAKNWRAAFTTDFQLRSDGWPALQKVYGLEFAEVKTMEWAALYKALADHQVDVVVGTATDAAISKMKLRALVDDRNAFAINQAAPVVRKATLPEYPDLEYALNYLAETIDSDTMKRMNDAVENGGRSVAEVAAEFVAAL